jgi:hypothetical protein
MGLFFRIAMRTQMALFFRMLIWLLQDKMGLFFRMLQSAQAAFSHATTESWYHGWRYGISRPAASLTIG